MTRRAFPGRRSLLHGHRRILQPTRTTLLLLLLPGLLTACVQRTLETEYQVAEGGSWKTLAPMPTPRSEVAAAALGNRIYVAGGISPSPRIVDAFEVYDVASNRWEKLTALPEPVHHAGAAALNGKVYIIGGFGGSLLSWQPKDHVWEYDPSAGRWRDRARLPTPRGALAAAVLQGRIYAIGGKGAKLLGVVERYDPVTDQWEAVRVLSVPREHLAAAVAAGKIYVIGGRSAFLMWTHQDNEAYDPRTTLWERQAPLPTGRSGLAAAVLRGRIHVFGGETHFWTFDRNEEYDPRADTWSLRAPMATGRHGLAAVTVGQSIYVLGGGTQPGWMFWTATGLNAAYSKQGRTPAGSPDGRERR